MFGAVEILQVDCHGRCSLNHGVGGGDHKVLLRLATRSAYPGITLCKEPFMLQVLRTNNRTGPCHGTCNTCTDISEVGGSLDRHRLVGCDHCYHMLRQI